MELFSLEKDESSWITSIDPIIDRDEENRTLELGDIDDIDKEQQKQGVGPNISSNSRDEANTLIVIPDIFFVEDHVVFTKVTPSECLHFFVKSVLLGDYKQIKSV